MDEVDVIPAKVFSHALFHLVTMSLLEEAQRILASASPPSELFG